MLGDYVTLDAGTGLVHSWTQGGDFYCHMYNLDVYHQWIIKVITANSWFLKECSYAKKPAYTGTYC